MHEAVELARKWARRAAFDIFHSLGCEREAREPFQLLHSEYAVVRIHPGEASDANSAAASARRATLLLGSHAWKWEGSGQRTADVLLLQPLASARLLTILAFSADRRHYYHAPTLCAAHRLRTAGVSWSGPSLACPARACCVWLARSTCHTLVAFP